MQQFSRHMRRKRARKLFFAKTLGLSDANCDIEASLRPTWQEGNNIRDRANRKNPERTQVMVSANLYPAVAVESLTIARRKFHTIVHASTTRLPRIDQLSPRTHNADCVIRDTHIHTQCLSSTRITPGRRSTPSGATVYKGQRCFHWDLCWA